MSLCRSSLSGSSLCRSLSLLNIRLKITHSFFNETKLITTLGLYSLYLSTTLGSDSLNLLGTLSGNKTNLSTPRRSNLRLFSGTCILYSLYLSTSFGAYASYLLGAFVRYR